MPARRRRPKQTLAVWSSCYGHFTVGVARQARHWSHSHSRPSIMNDGPSTTSWVLTQSPLTASPSTFIEVRCSLQCRLALSVLPSAARNTSRPWAASRARTRPAASEIWHSRPLQPFFFTVVQSWTLPRFVATLTEYWHGDSYPAI
ncbi:hypothetical protein EXIGLDRAFT_415705 [Exidia glandulosa HHB12029]|uniref:Uncharacterized protein n=1 Tax=Exidia glandulosa HHB12029 TaxID=1314781 RepID=A0A165PRL6_EXIGL|nr:hypothetical protein EXIGLDRAFT_415705 [Exidia glandulosa HHB12029]